MKIPPYAAVLNGESLDLGQRRERRSDTCCLREDIVHSGGVVAGGTEANERKIVGEVLKSFLIRLSANKLNGWRVSDIVRNHSVSHSSNSLTYRVHPRTK